MLVRIDELKGQYEDHDGQIVTVHLVRVPGTKTGSCEGCYFRKWTTQEFRSRMVEGETCCQDFFGCEDAVIKNIVS